MPISAYDSGRMVLYQVLTFSYNCNAEFVYFMVLLFCVFILCIL